LVEADRWATDVVVAVMGVLMAGTSGKVVMMGFGDLVLTLVLVFLETMLALSLPVVLLLADAR